MPGAVAVPQGAAAGGPTATDAAAAAAGSGRSTATALAAIAVAPRPPPHPNTASAQQALSPQSHQAQSQQQSQQLASAIAVRLTPGLPPIPTLRDAAGMIARLAPRQTDLLAYVRHIRPPHPAVVVAFGVLCVLLD
jgi:hypothetical protein